MVMAQPTHSMSPLKVKVDITFQSVKTILMEVNFVGEQWASGIGITKNIPVVI